MSFRTRRILKTTPLFMIMEYIVLRYLLSLFSVTNDIMLIPMVLILGAMQCVPMLFEEKKSTRTGRFVSTLFGIWEWVFVMLLIYLAVIFIVEYFIRIPPAVLSLILLTIPAIGAYAYINAHRIVVKERTLVFDNLKKEYNIIHISDVHFGSIRHEKIIRDITSKIQELTDNSDIVVISGDLADGSCVIEEDDFMEFKKVNIPIIFTSGNHDYYPGLENVHKACKKAGMIILENQGTTYGNLNIYGLSFSFDDIEMPTTEQLKAFIDKDKINIVNYHVPTGWDALSEIGFDIQLSGHTHGGQFYPAVWLGNFFYGGYNMGLFKRRINDSKHYLHVTTGVGIMDFPMRWGTNSEIVVLRLRKTQ